MLGTLAAVALVRGGRFRGRLAFSGLVYAPLVMPEIIIGLALLLLFVAVDVDRGFWTVTIAHSTVKKHINNIFGKLGTQSRTQALARARELGLL